MKKIFYDIEVSTLDLLLSTYQLKNNIRYFDPDNIVRDKTLLGAAWVFDDDEEPEIITVRHTSPLNDKWVVKKLHAALTRADVLIGHNSDAFDLKEFNTAAIRYDLPPIGQKVQIDTLKMARKYFRFPSNKLSYLCKKLGLSNKDHSPDWELILEGDKDEIEYMGKYNGQDVLSTRELYYKLAAFHDTHPRIKPLAKDISGNTVTNCKKCGGSLRRNGTRLTATGIRKQMMTCNDCGGYQTETYNANIA